MVAEPGRLDWTDRAEHIRTRSHRNRDDVDIEPGWANEAVTDPLALVDSPDPASKSGESDRCTGYSATAGMVITVIYLREHLIGLTAWPATRTDRRRYREAQQ